MTIIKILIIALIIYFLIEWDENKTAKRIKREAPLNNKLYLLCKILENNGWEYIYNTPGSGEMSYRKNGKIVDFHSFAHKFSGFYYDGELITEDKLLAL